MNHLSTLWDDIRWQWRLSMRAWRRGSSERAWRRSRSSRLFAAFLLTLILGYVLWFITTIIWMSIEYRVEGPGIFGDSFGTVNAFFSCAALLGVLFGLLQGQRQLRIQQRDLKQNQVDVREQKEQLKQQTRHLATQSFADHFFHLLTALQNAIDGVRIEQNNKEYHGRQALSFFVKAWEGLIMTPKPANEDELKAAYGKVENNLMFGTAIGAINRLLVAVAMHVLRADDGTIPAQQKQAYTDIIVANLSAAELRTLAFHARYNIEQPLGQVCYQLGLLRELRASNHFVSLGEVQAALNDHWSKHNLPKYRSDGN